MTFAEVRGEICKTLDRFVVEWPRERGDAGTNAFSLHFRDLLEAEATKTSSPYQRSEYYLRALASKAAFALNRMLVRRYATSHWINTCVANHV